MRIYDSDLSRLVALQVDQMTANHNGGLFSTRARRPVKQLRVCNMPHISSEAAMTPSIVETFCSTLQCLEIACLNIDQFRHDIEAIPGLLLFAPHLKELAVLASSANTSPTPAHMSSEDLVG